MALRGAIAGLLSGILLGLFLKFAEQFSGEKVYVLLLNIDFIYSRPLPELAEFILHLAVAVAIGIVCSWMTRAFRLSEGKVWAASFLLTLPAALLYFPLTILAVKETPGIFNIEAISWWIAGHILFAAVLAACIHKKTPQR
ncbi:MULTISPECIES: hypothetical protein [Metabacillus]|uniref:hypothetical protein n=1 Tax=Metabacillus TaxID=2675233 RepID=UPI00054E5B5C|nr:MULTISPECIES: hypothetical protein [Metabacillus]MDX8288204.1 hypothetical protein [Metabacillus indicus]